ncbi:hypothetical protein DSO57_1000865 [Entomophthora muscae]|uniref:Uncharacterized protein n=1 Tax=Entomophthora muscae TaxID=34485 RepID=A0ACC2U811_9FUNG|nr:hypothetical protein DSO57_1000865 [Entomophthora muscae]
MACDQLANQDALSNLESTSQHYIAEEYQRQHWETEQLLAAYDPLMLALVSYPRVLDQKIAPAPAPLLSFPGVPLLRQLAPLSQLMSAATGEHTLCYSRKSNGRDSTST